MQSAGHIDRSVVFQRRVQSLRPALGELSAQGVRVIGEIIALKAAEGNQQRRQQQCSADFSVPSRQPQQGICPQGDGERKGHKQEIHAVDVHRNERREQDSRAKPEKQQNRRVEALFPQRDDQAADQLPKAKQGEGQGDRIEEPEAAGAVPLEAIGLAQKNLQGASQILREICKRNFI